MGNIWSKPGNIVLHILYSVNGNGVRFTENGTDVGCHHHLNVHLFMRCRPKPLEPFLLFWFFGPPKMTSNYKMGTMNTHYTCVRTKTMLWNLYNGFVRMNTVPDQRRFYFHFHMLSFFSIFLFNKRIHMPRNRAIDI